MASFVQGIVGRIDAMRGITPVERRRMRIVAQWRRTAAKASGPGHLAEIDAVFSRGLDELPAR